MRRTESEEKESYARQFHQTTELCKRRLRKGKRQTVAHLFPLLLATDQCVRMETKKEQKTVEHKK